MSGYKHLLSVGVVGVALVIGTPRRSPRRGQPVGGGGRRQCAQVGIATSLGQNRCWRLETST